MMCLVTIILIGLGISFPIQAEAVDPAHLAQRIDHHLKTRWEEVGITPAPVVDDATFVRRIYLDLIGRIPTIVEARDFRLNDDSNKRAALVVQLLESPDHYRHIAVYWRRAWIPQLDTKQFAGIADGFEKWLTAELKEGVTYDQIAHQLITATSDGGAAAGPSIGAKAFIRASEAEPANLAANTSRAFLGLNLDCAQCHDHPFARWTRDQFWQTAAFFVESTPNRNVASGRLELVIPDTEEVVAAQLLPADTPFRSDDTVRGSMALADWVTSAENPYFARNAVNLLWANFFGTGLVEPLDDLSEVSPASRG